MDWIKKNRFLLVIMVAVLLLGAVALSVRKSEIPVRAENIRRETIANSISTNGKVEPVENFQARALGPAPVRHVLVKEGDHVKAGQLLVQLDDSDARAQAARARAQIKAAEAELATVKKGGTQDEALANQSNLIKAKAEYDTAERNLTAMHKLREAGSASDGEVQEAENRMKKAQAEIQFQEKRQSARYSNPEIARMQAQADEARAAYAAAQNLLRNSNITAPRAGTVYSLPVREGAFVSGGDLIVQVADLSKMQVRAFVDEPDIGKLAKGQTVTFTWDAVAGRVWEGKVSNVPTTVVTRGTRNVGEVVCAVDNHDRKLLPNVNLNVIITTARQENVLTLSREAVVPDNGKRFIYVIQDGHLKRTEVETGVSNLTRIQILSGAEEKTLVALGAQNQQPLTDQAPVRIIEQ